ncbi:hypothetical protein [Salipiger sp.]|uniref:hypothetical protein n=1 Tax=Salipiger sp. TaxID=2078585 RepID=UPI003A970D1C
MGVTSVDSGRLSQILVSLGAVWMAAILFGWLTGFEDLSRVASHRAGTVPSTALAIALLFVAAMEFDDQDRCSALIRHKLTSIALAIAAANLLLSLAGRSDIDHSLFDAIIRPVDRMSPGTALGIIVACATIWLAGAPETRRLSAAVAVVALSALTAIVLGNAFVPGVVFGKALLSGMSLYTALALGLFFLAHLLKLDACDLGTPSLPDCD